MYTRTEGREPRSKPARTGMPALGPHPGSVPWGPRARAAVEGVGGQGCRRGKGHRAGRKGPLHGGNGPAAGKPALTAFP